MAQPQPPREPDDDGTTGGQLAVLPLRGGEHVGRYVILYTLGRGGMGVVYAAYDPQLDRKLAIKVMRPRGRREAQRAELLREAQALAKLSDPHVVAVHDVGLVGDRVFVAMDLVDGQTLRRWAVASPRSVPEIVRVYLQAGQGLAAAHRAGIVHRDFKPDNALIGKDGRVQVLDFGLARVRDGERATPSDGEEPRPSGDPPGRARGTPMYMAPEQHLGRDAGPACDQWALCASLYEALWRRVPFAGDDNAAIAQAILRGPLPDPPRIAGVNARLRRAILRGLARDPQQRFPSMEALVAELRAAITRRRKVRFAFAGLVVGAAASSALLARNWLGGPPPCEQVPARIAEAWNQDHAQAVTAALRSTGRAHATQSAAGVQQALDGFVARWTDGWRDACEASVVRHEQSAELLDLRMACLDAGRERLVALVDTLQRADGEIADRALQATDALPDLSACADAAALRRREPLPADADERAQLEELRMRVAHAAALVQAGKGADALAVAEVAARRAHEHAHHPTIAEAELTLGRALDLLGRTQQAELALRRAAIAAEHADDDRLLADARTLLVSVAGAQQERRGDGELWAELAAAALERLGHDARREATLEHNLSRVLEQNGRPEDVLEHQRRALALASEPGVMGELERAPLYSSLAMTLSDTGEFDEALSRARAALDIWQRAYGDDHPGTAGAVGAVGIVLDRRGDLPGALQWYERSHAALARVLGEDNPRTADMLTNVAVAALELGELERGIALLQRALAAHSAASGEQSADVAQDHQNLGSALRLVGRIDEALAHHRAALSIREGLFGPDDIRVAHSLVGVANVLEDDLDQPEESYELRTRALALEERAWGPEHPQLSLALANLGHNALALGDRDAALRHAERAVRLSSDAAVPAETRAFAELVLALVLARRGDDEARARSLLERGRAGAGRDVDRAAADLIAATEAALGRARVSPKPAPRRAPAPPRP
ncbi:MAG: serine/threonine-protein kinase [Nannocystaceae bacterium]|nr:serine/threonine-protein kinase [Nannocystaceae bacterium]